MTIKLKRLRLDNFRGIADQTISFEDVTNIYGANESGKSTLYAAYLWLLTGKDQEDRKDYEIKNTRLKEMNSMDHTVEAEFVLLDGDMSAYEIKLRRTYIEKWVKQKGAAKKVFEGHKTEYFYNDTPCNQSEFQKKVDAIIAPELIKLVSNPTYFNSLNWQDQRRGLIGIAGEITNQDVINSLAKNKFTDELIHLLSQTKDLEQFRREIAVQKNLLKKEALEFAPRIDELRKSLMPEGMRGEDLEKEASKIKIELANIDAQMLSASQALKQQQTGVLEKQKELHALDKKFAQLQHNTRSELLKKENEADFEKTRIANQITGVKYEISSLQKDKISESGANEILKQRIEQGKRDVEDLRSKWSEVNRGKFVFDDAESLCPTCKQELPASDIEQRRETLQKNFNDNVAKRKADLVVQSNSIKEAIAGWESQIGTTNYDEQIKAAEDRLTALEHRAIELDASEKLDVDKLLEKALNESPEFDAIIKEIARVSAEIEKELPANDRKDNPFAQKKEQVTEQLNAINVQISTAASNKKIIARIADLDEAEKKNAQDIADLENKEFQIEQFTRTKMDILEQRVNGLFKYVKFRLFATQVNGAIVEDCVCTYKDVPYPALNNAAQLLAGIDVLNTLSAHYNVGAPVWIDNRESCSWIPETDSQIVNLFVSPEDKKLRVTYSNTKEFA